MSVPVPRKHGLPVAADAPGVPWSGKDSLLRRIRRRLQSGTLRRTGWGQFLAIRRLWTHASALTRKRTTVLVSDRDSSCASSGKHHKLSRFYPLLATRLPTSWSQPGSNRRPPACKAGALPTELWPRRSSSLRRWAGGSGPDRRRGGMAIRRGVSTGRLGGAAPSFIRTLLGSHLVVMALLLASATMAAADASLTSVAWCPRASTRRRTRCTSATRTRV
jgi:hypothetical protein